MDDGKLILNIIFRKAYLKEFLIGYYDNSHPIKPEASDIVGLILKPLLEKKPDKPYPLQLQHDIKSTRKDIDACRDRNQRQTLERKLHNSQKLLSEWRSADFLQIQMPQYYGIRPESMNYLSPGNQRLFESLIYALFKTLFYQSVNIRVECGYTQYDSIMMFAYDFNISFNSTNYDTLKKNYDRYSAEMKKLNKTHKKNVVKMSRVLSESMAICKLVQKASINQADMAKIETPSAV